MLKKIVIIVGVGLLFLRLSAVVYGDYQLAWPGMLPDNKFYKLKVLRDKLIGKMIIDSVDKVRFDLLMADKMIYASKLLLEKGQISLAKDTALKGENYYSLLVQDYNSALLRGEKIPLDLDRNITLAAQKHQEIFTSQYAMVSITDKNTFAVADKFSKINYQFIVGLRIPKENKSTHAK